MCRFLDESFREELYHTFIAAFSDYVLPFELTYEQFQLHLRLNAVDLGSSVGIFHDDKMIAFTMNGVDDWNGRRTIYDAGTGVLPVHRRSGHGMSMFDDTLPHFKQAGLEQYLLEVISTNTNAVSMYEKLGFIKERELLLLQTTNEIVCSSKPDGLTIRPITDPDWNQLTTFWDGYPAWQNSVAAIERCRDAKHIIGAFIDGDCVGYVVFSTRSPKIAQIAVAREYRRRGIGTHLLASVRENSAINMPTKVLNLDRSIQSATAFFDHHGFEIEILQYEMRREL